jgi:hypothetical protein
LYTDTLKTNPELAKELLVGRLYAAEERMKGQFRLVDTFRKHLATE